MRTKSPLRLAAAFAVFSLAAGAGAALPARAAGPDAPSADASPAALLAEVRRSFTLHGKPIPPEIFRDLGDGDIADSGSIWVTVDVAAAIGSNLYYDDIKQNGDWVIQTKTRQKDTDDWQQTGYKFIGATDSGLLVAIATYNGGGSGTFITLHILDVAAARAFDLEGKLYRRINLTAVRSVILGDRWDGDVRISGNAIRIVTTRNGPADEAPRAPVTITATRP